MNDKQRMDTIKESLSRVKENIERISSIESIAQQNNALYVAILKAKEAAVYLLDLESVSPKDTIKSVLLTIDKLALAMAQENRKPSLENAIKALTEANTSMPRIVLQ
jgi:hypothetical protein